MNELEKQQLRSAEAATNKLFENSDCTDTFLRKVDAIHSKSTRDWVLKIEPQANIELQIAALGHDIDRTIESRRIKKEDNVSYDDFKQLHAAESAKMMAEVLENLNFSKKQISRIIYLIKNHEVGGDREANILKEADSLSFFDYSIYDYLKERGAEMTYKKVKFMFERMSNEGKDQVKKLKFDVPDIQNIINRVSETN